MVPTRQRNYTEILKEILSSLFYGIAQKRELIRQKKLAAIITDPWYFFITSAKKNLYPLSNLTLRNQGVKMEGVETLL